MQLASIRVLVNRFCVDVRVRAKKTLGMSRVDIIFVDLQGFVVDENFRVKEIAVLKRERELTHHIFGPFVEWTRLESDDRSRASWLTHNHHGLEWDEGDIEYARAGTLIERALTVDLDRVSVFLHKDTY